MVRGRGWLAGALASALAVTGMTVATVAPASATPGNTTVTCTLEVDPDFGGPVQHCLFADPDGIRTMRTRDVATGSVGGVDLTFLCQFPDRPTTNDFKANPATKLLLTITDCEHPRSHAYFMLRADGTVNEIRNV
jgi:hypothetical protein